MSNRASAPPRAGSTESASETGSRMTNRIRPTLYVGLGEFGVNLISRWLTLLSRQLPHALPLVDSLGFFYPGAEVDQGLAPRPRFVPGQAEPVLSFLPWCHSVRSLTRADAAELTEDAALERPPDSTGLSQYNESLVSRIQSRYMELAGMEAPPRSWAFATDPGVAPRIVLVGHLHDPIIVERLLSEHRPVHLPDSGSSGDSDSPDHASAKPGDLLSVLWRSIVTEQGLSEMQRDIWLLLFVDPPPSENSAETKGLLSELDSVCRKLVGDCRFGLHPVLISSYSRPSGASQVRTRRLWSGEENWDGGYTEKAHEYGLTLLQTLLASDGSTGQTSRGSLARQMADYQMPDSGKLFYTVSLQKLDSIASWARRYAVARCLHDDVRACLRGVSGGTDPQAKEGRIAGLLGNPAEWIKKQSDIGVLETASQTGREPPPDRSIESLEVDDTGSVRLEIEELRADCRRLLYTTEARLTSLAAVFGDPVAAKSRFDAALRRRCQTDVEGGVGKALDAELLAAMQAGGVVACGELLGRLAAALEREASRVRATFEWPPERPSNDGVMDGIDGRIRQMTASDLVNRRAMVFHGGVAGAVLALGATMLASGFFDPGLRKTLVMIVSGLAAGAIPLLIVFVFCLRWRRQAVELARVLKRSRDRIALDIGRRAGDLKERFRETYGQLYRLRALRCIRRAVRRQAVRCAEMKQALDGALESSGLEAQEITRRTPTTADWLAFYFDRAEFEGQCNSAHAQLKKVLEGEQGSALESVALPRTCDIAPGAPIRLKIAEREQQIARKAGDVDLTSGEMWREWMRLHMTGSELPALPLCHSSAGISPSDSSSLPGSETIRFVLCSPESEGTFADTLASTGGADIVRCFPYLPAGDETMIIGRFFWRVSLDDINFEVI